MTLDQDLEIKSLLADLDAALAATADDATDVRSPRALIEQVRACLAGMATTPGAAPETSDESLWVQQSWDALSPDLQEAPAETAGAMQAMAQGILRSMQQEIDRLRQNAVAPIQTDLEALRQQRRTLSEEITQLENQRQYYQSLAQQQANQEQIIGDFLHQLRDRLQASITDQVSQLVTRSESATTDQELVNLETSASGVLDRLQTTLNAITTSLQSNSQRYEEALNAALERMHVLGEESEAILDHWLSRLASTLGRELPAEGAPASAPNPIELTGDRPSLTATSLALSALETSPAPGCETPASEPDLALGDESQAAAETGLGWAAAPAAIAAAGGLALSGLAASSNAEAADGAESLDIDFSALDLPPLDAGVDIPATANADFPSDLAAVDLASSLDFETTDRSEPDASAVAPDAIDAISEAPDMAITEAIAPGVSLAGASTESSDSVDLETSEPTLIGIDEEIFGDVEAIFRFDEPLSAAASPEAPATGAEDASLASAIGDWDPLATAAISTVSGAGLLAAIGTAEAAAEPLPAASLPIDTDLSLVPPSLDYHAEPDVTAAPELPEGQSLDDITDAIDGSGDVTDLDLPWVAAATEPVAEQWSGAIADDVQSIEPTLAQPEPEAPWESAEEFPAADQSNADWISGFGGGGVVPLVPTDADTDLGEGADLALDLGGDDGDLDFATIDQGAIEAADQPEQFDQPDQFNQLDQSVDLGWEAATSPEVTATDFGADFGTDLNLGIGEAIGLEPIADETADLAALEDAALDDIDFETVETSLDSSPAAIDLELPAETTDLSPLAGLGDWSTESAAVESADEGLDDSDLLAFETAELAAESTVDGLEDLGDALTSAGEDLTRDLNQWDRIEIEDFSGSSELSPELESTADLPDVGLPPLAAELASESEDLGGDLRDKLAAWQQGGEAADRTEDAVPNLDNGGIDDLGFDGGIELEPDVLSAFDLSPDTSLVAESAPEFEGSWSDPSTLDRDANAFDELALEEDLASNDLGAIELPDTTFEPASEPAIAEPADSGLAALGEISEATDVALWGDESALELVDEAQPVGSDADFGLALDEEPPAMAAPDSADLGLSDLGIGDLETGTSSSTDFGDDLLPGLDLPSEALAVDEDLSLSSSIASLDTDLGLAAIVSSDTEVTGLTDDQPWGGLSESPVEAGLETALSTPPEPEIETDLGLDLESALQSAAFEGGDAFEAGLEMIAGLQDDPTVSELSSAFGESLALDDETSPLMEDYTTAGENLEDISADVDWTAALAAAPGEPSEAIAFDRPEVDQSIASAEVSDMGLDLGEDWQNQQEADFALGLEDSAESAIEPAPDFGSESGLDLGLNFSDDGSLDVDAGLDFAPEAARESSLEADFASGLGVDAIGGVDLGSDLGSGLESGLTGELADELADFSIDEAEEPATGEGWLSPESIDNALDNDASEPDNAEIAGLGLDNLGELDLGSGSDLGALNLGESESFASAVDDDAAAWGNLSRDLANAGSPDSALDDLDLAAEDTSSIDGLDNLDFGLEPLELDAADSGFPDLATDEPSLNLEDLPSDFTDDLPTDNGTDPDFSSALTGFDAGVTSGTMDLLGDSFGNLSLPTNLDPIGLDATLTEFGESAVSPLGEFDADLDALLSESLLPDTDLDETKKE